MSALAPISSRRWRGPERIAEEAAILSVRGGPLKILLWHGYLLGGTGSNVYTRSLARVWSRLGHEVIVFCQDPDPSQVDLGSTRVVRPEARVP